MSCPPPPPRLDECAEAPQSCPVPAPIKNCIEDPARCAQEIDRDDEEDVEAIAAPLGGNDPPRRSTDPAGAADQDADPLSAALPDSTPRADGASPRSSVTIEADGILDRIGRGLIDAAERFAFPLGLASVVAAFLVVQGRIDRREPKLAAAPVDSRDDVVLFR